jgi:hypothetical protein
MAMFPNNVHDKTPSTAEWKNTIKEKDPHRNKAGGGGVLALWPTTQKQQNGSQLAYCTIVKAKSHSQKPSKSNSQLLQTIASIKPLILIGKRPLPTMTEFCSHVRSMRNNRKFLVLQSTAVLSKPSFLVNKNSVSGCLESTLY